jgi:replication factor C subunit 3/5
MRRALNLLQSVAASQDVINELSVYSCAGHPLPSDIDRVLSALLNERLTQAVQTIRDIQLAKGIALQDILFEIHPFVYRIDFPTSVQIVILERLAEIEFRLARGSSEKLQLSALVAAFQSARDLPTCVATGVATPVATAIE